MVSQEKNRENSDYFYLEKFFEALQIQVDSIDRGANPPDFILKQATKRITVEVTEFHSDATGSEGHPRRLIEEEWLKLQQLIEEARLGYPDLNEISGLLFFKKLELPSRPEYAQFVRELLDFLRISLKSVTKKGIELTLFNASFPLLRKYLKKVYIRNINCYTTWEWNHSAASVGLNESELKNTISRKIGIPRPKSVSENWLLIVSGHQLSQSMGLPGIQKLNSFGEVNKMLENGPYDKVFIFQYMFDRVLLWEPSSNWVEVRKARFADGKGKNLESCN